MPYNWVCLTSYAGLFVIYDEGINRTLFYTKKHVSEGQILRFFIGLSVVCFSNPHKTFKNRMSNNLQFPV